MTIKVTKLNVNCPGHGQFMAEKWSIVEKFFNDNYESIQGLSKEYEKISVQKKRMSLKVSIAFLLINSSLILLIDILIIDDKCIKSFLTGMLEKKYIAFICTFFIISSDLS